MRKVTIDFETYSELDVRDVGAEVYARHPSTDIICMAYSIDDAEPKLWAPWLPFPEDLRDTLCILDPVVVEAHNSGFERAIWNFVGRPRYDFPPIQSRLWRCTMAACAYKGVALKLERAAQMLKLEQQKDMAGNAAMRYLSKPSAKGRREDFARFEACAEYCAQDVRTEVALSRVVGELPPDELRLWQLDQTINQRGVRIDTGLCEAAIAIADRVETRLVEEFADLTGGLKPTQRDKVLGWLRQRAPEWMFPDLTAETVGEALRQRKDIPDDAARAVEIRQQIARSSVKKYKTALACLCPDGRARGLLQYHGAQPGRWAGRLIQPQNMPRPTYTHLPMEDLVSLIKERDEEAIHMLGLDPMTVLADATRGMIIPAEGHVLAPYDFSAIEAVVNACIAGEDWKVAAFRRKEDVYCLFAEVVYGHPVTKEDQPSERQTGKTGELAFGYQGGVAAWRKFDSSDRHTDEEVNAFKNAWRQKHSHIVGLWAGLDGAAKRAVVYGGPESYAGIRYQLEGQWLSCQLPSGRKIWYLHPRIVMAEMPWTDYEGEAVHKPAVEFTAYKEGQIKTVRGYGGHWTENVVQAAARDIMVRAMWGLEKANYPIVLTVHDEVVTEIPEAMAERALSEIPKLMTDHPPWAKDWPIGVEGGVTRRYSK